MRRSLAPAALALAIFAATGARAEPVPGFAEPPRVAAPVAAEAVAPAAKPADIAPPDLPPVVVTVEAAAPDAVAVDIAPPDLPPVVVAVETPEQRPVDAARTDIAPPDLPEARIIVDAPPVAPSAEIAAALKARLDKDGTPAHPRLTRALREEIAAFYAAREHAPLWISATGLTPAGRALADRLRRADEDALDPAAYGTPTAAKLLADPAALALADLELSVAAVIYARDARGGRIDAKRLSNLIDPTIDLPDAAETLRALAAAGDAGAALAGFNPPHAGYRALRDKLRELREGRERVASVSIPQGPVLRVGMSDARVALVRERLRIAPLDDATYDAAVADAVAGFQRERGLPANGALTRQTVAALSSSINQVEADIIANMERWRWLPRDLGERRIVVNVPEFQMRVMEGETVLHQARVIVGKPDTPTPIFSDVMRFLVVNPSWFVPPSILRKEFLPKLAEDPAYAERRGYEVIRRGNSVTIRQPPGERNALGNIKFMFPNRHAVYLHDTPTRHLFGADRRAFSHGCVRVDQPLKLAEIALGADNGWTEAKVRSLIGRGERSVKMERTLPIHLVYFTSFVDDLGRLQQRDDLYGHHRRVRAALGLNG